MQSKIINIPFSENIIDFTADLILPLKGRTALISGGKRPFLFIKKKLAEKLQKTFYPPVFLTNDDFIWNITFNNSNLSKIPDIEAAYMLYETIRDEVPGLLKGKKSFAEFLQWALEILSFIEQLDLENVSEEKLKNIKVNADIGYDVPENINNLLKNIFRIRKAFHSLLEKENKTTKGYSSLKASLADAETTAGDYDNIILMTPFYLHKTEAEVFKKIFSLGKLTVIVQGNPHEYETLRNIYTVFSLPVPEIKKQNHDFNLNIYSAFDGQSQASLLKNLISGINEKDHNKTVIVVPDEKMLPPVVSEISSLNSEFNISAGYPASKTALFVLINSIIEAQLSRKNKNYYAKDIIKVLTNPLVKNLRFLGDSSLTRITVHKIEAALDSGSRSPLSGKLFTGLDEIAADEELVNEISLSVTKAWEYVSPEKIRGALENIFYTLFVQWEKPESLSGFSELLLSFIEKLLGLSTLGSYPLNNEAAEILISTAEELKYGKVASLRFLQNDILNIVKDLIENKKIALPGSPLKGMQILGLLESRNLNFKNVYITGMSDSAIPAVKKESPLVPKDIMYALGIEMASREFEIQSYHFYRLISGAENVNLIYPDNEKEERSRFIEQLIWKKQSALKDINAGKVTKFSVGKKTGAKPGKRKYGKTPGMKKFLSDMKYSYSKIDTYLRCRLEFYFRYVLGLEEGIEVGKEISGSDIGTFIHNFLQEVFFEGLKFDELKKEEYKAKFFKKLDDKFAQAIELKFREDSFLIKKVLDYRMGKLLEFEKERQFSEIYKCEKKYVSSIETGKNVYKLECIIDRIDKTGKEFAIFDYKTGKVASPIVSKNFTVLLSGGYTRENIKKAVKSLQLPMYKYIFEKCEPHQASLCAVYDIKKAELIDFTGKLPDGAELYKECINIIVSILEEINNDQPFEFDEKDSENCKNCKFFYICR